MKALLYQPGDGLKPVQIDKADWAAVLGDGGEVPETVELFYDVNIALVCSKNGQYQGKPCCRKTWDESIGRYKIEVRGPFVLCRYDAARKRYYGLTKNQLGERGGSLSDKGTVEFFGKSYLVLHH